MLAIFSMMTLWLRRDRHAVPRRDCNKNSRAVPLATCPVSSPAICGHAVPQCNTEAGELCSAVVQDRPNQARPRLSFDGDLIDVTERRNLVLSSVGVAGRGMLTMWEASKRKLFKDSCVQSLSLELAPVLSSFMQLPHRRALQV